MGLLGYFRGITERKRAEAGQKHLNRQLADRVGELQTLLDSAPIAVWIAHDPECSKITGNAYADHIIMQVPRVGNISNSALPGNEAVPYKILRDAVELAPEELPAQVAAATGKPVGDALVELVFADGRRVHLLIGALPLFDVEGHVRGAVATGADLTPLKHAEDVLRESEEKYRSLFESLDESFILGRILRDGSGNAGDLLLLDVNSAWERLFGLSGKVAGRMMSEVMPELVPYWLGVADRVLSGGETVRGERCGPLSGMWGEFHAYSPGEDLLAVLWSDITGRKRGEAEQEMVVMELSESRAQLQASFESMVEGLGVWDRDGTLLMMNPAGLKLLGMESLEGYPGPFREGQGRYELHYPDGRPIPQEEDPRSRVLTGECIKDFEAVVTWADTGEETTWSYSGIPVRDDSGEVTQAVITWRDITEQKRAEAEMERLLGQIKDVNSRLVTAGILAKERAEAELEARELAERAVRLRGEFLSLAAHELKTPVTSLRGFAQAIVREHKRGVLEEAHLIRAMGHIDRQTARLAKLTEQLLDVSTLEAGRPTMSLKETEIPSLVDHVVSSYRMVHPRREFLLCDGPSVRAHVDPLMIEQVITNLVDNAVKFSPAETPVEIGVALEGPEHMAISVRDYGMGVPEADRRKVFDCFYQAHPQDHFGGLGLGLYISAQVVEMHGGTITCEAPEGVGTRFVVRLPLRGGIGRLDL